MNDTAQDATTRSLVIQGLMFEMPLRYFEGHVLTAVEARVLNQTLAENIRNNFARTVKASLADDDGAPVQEDLPRLFAEAYEAYEFSSGASGTTHKLDPLEKEIKRLATDVVREALDASGRSIRAPKGLTDDQKAEFKAKIDAAVAKCSEMPSVISTAKSNIKRQLKLAEEATAMLDSTPDTATDPAE